MNSVFLDLCPGTVLLLPYEHAAIVWARSKNAAKLGMSPGDLPDRTLMTDNYTLEEGKRDAKTKTTSHQCQMHVPFQSFYQLLLVTVNIKDLDGAVWWCCGESARIVVKLCIMLWTREVMVMMILNERTWRHRIGRTMVDEPHEKLTIMSSWWVSSVWLVAAVYW